MFEVVDERLVRHGRDHLVLFAQRLEHVHDVLHGRLGVDRRLEQLLSRGRSDAPGAVQSDLEIRTFHLA